MEWGGRVFAYCAEKGFDLNFSFYSFHVMFFDVTFRPFVYLSKFSLQNLYPSYSDFIFSNMTENEEEKGVTRLALTCVQDWGETGAHGNDEGMIEQKQIQV